MPKPLERIHSYFNCRMCAGEARAQNVAAAKYARLRVGLTREGLQVWCARHDMEVGHFTPEQLAGHVANGPRCECCPDGMHRS